MRREIPLLITFIVGTSLVVAIFIPHAPFPRLDGELSVWFDIIAVFAFILGGGNLLKVHIDRITRKQRDSFYSGVTIAGFLLTLGIGLLKIGGNPGLKGNYIFEGNYATTLRSSDLLNPAGLSVELRDSTDPLSKYIRGQLSPESQRLLDEYRGNVTPSDQNQQEQVQLLRAALVSDLNVLLRQESFYNEQRFAAIDLPEETRAMIAEKPQETELLRLNRLLLTTAYPREIARYGPTWFKIIYDAFFVPLSATMFSLLAFFVASASYRAFRAKTREATVLLIAAFIILVGRTPLGYYATFWLPEPLQFLQISNLSAWILSTPNLAAQRAIMIGISLGIIATSLKLILGIERSYLGQEK